MDELTEPETYVLFVKTNKAQHQGGFAIFSIDAIDAATEIAQREVKHVIESAQNADADVVFESWGFVNSVTGEVAAEHDSYE